MTNKSTYAEAGVDYSTLDPTKVLAQKSAQTTAGLLSAFDAKEIAASRGESAYVWQEAAGYRAMVMEGLGTKNLIADDMRAITGRTHYDTIAQDTVAAIVNDLIVVGALPQVISAYFAIGHADWMRDQERARDLIKGWADACCVAGASWGGGETPTLKDIIQPQTIDLGGSAVGVVHSDEPILGQRLAVNDVIILVESSGIHTNGISFVRMLATRDRDFYKIKLPDGRLLGEALLTPTNLYVALVKSILAAQVDVHYMVHITGHGWRKLMRAPRTFRYVIDTVPPVHPEFQCIQETATITDQEMYSTFNMGTGFAIYVPANQADKVLELAAAQHMIAVVAGHLEKGPQEIVIAPRGIVFGADTLQVR